EKKFGEEYAVKGVTFDLNGGKIFGFIGPSGSGKTTTIRMLTGFYRPTDGEVTVFDRPPTEFTTDMRRRIGYMPQLFVFYPNLSLWENLNFAASIYGMPFFGRRNKKLREILEIVELTGHTNKLAREVSGGMQRRLSLAATLIHDPTLIFLDEPTAGVDPVLRRKFWGHFHELRDQGRTIFITTQYVTEAAYCDLVGVINQGKLLVVDTPKGLRYSAFGGDVIDVHTKEHVEFHLKHSLEQLPFVRGGITRTSETSIRMIVDEASTDIPLVIEWAKQRDVEIESVEEYLPGFDDVFVELIGKENGHA
ncbi:MAG TPA: ABC transporter ATP-binding protein, partial [Anaerolineales bacterium]|nr:ABC transporter ATP-binding protein [Anaerolineales bacterium]